MCRVRRLLRTLCLELTRLCHKYHHQRIRDHQNGFVVSRLTEQTGFEFILLYESSPAETWLTVYRRLSIQKNL